MSYRNFNPYSFGNRKKLEDPNAAIKERKPRKRKEPVEPDFVVPDRDYQKLVASKKLYENLVSGSTTEQPQAAREMTFEQKHAYNRKRFTELTGYLLSDPEEFVSDEELAELEKNKEFYKLSEGEVLCL